VLDSVPLLALLGIYQLNHQLANGYKGILANFTQAQGRMDFRLNLSSF
jgi:hypothetical protein